MDEIQQKKENILKFIREKQNYIIYLLLAIVIWLGAFIRTRGLPFLQKKYVLALDPNVILRYVNYIVENGKLFAIDKLRYYPFGYDTSKDLGFLSYIIAYMYKFFHIFKPSMTSSEFVIIYPVIMFILSMVVFFFLIKLLFNDKKIALISTAFLAVMPAFLYRTMAGFSEKEPLGILLMMIVFLFYVMANKAKTLKKYITFGILTGISTGILAVVWGGVQFIIIIIPLHYLILLILRGYEKKQFYIYLSWLVPLLMVFALRGTDYIMNIIYSTTTLLYLFVLSFALLTLIISKYKIKEKIKINLPNQIIALILIILLGMIVGTIFYGTQFIANKIEIIKFQLLNPIGTGVFESTVAEAHKPYFTTWWDQFHYFFYVFFIGSIYMFYNLVKNLKAKYKYPLTLFFTLFSIGLIFSRYSSTSRLNGDNSLSVFMYIASLLIFSGAILILYLYTYYKDKDTFNSLSKLNTYLLFTLIWYVSMVIGARGVIRLIFVFAPITAITGGYLIGKIFNKFLETKINYKKIILLIIILFIFLAPTHGSFSNYVKSTYNTAKHTGPSFNDQWVAATDWIKDNTPEDSVFAHWWDYGYWVQTGANRATLSDGGNNMANINHYIGRHVLTAQSPEEALTFLKTYEANYLLIIKEEIGKYGAYASIGSDKSQDRYSYVPSFFSEQSEIQESQDGELRTYRGTFVFDQNINYNGIQLTRYNSAIIGILLKVKNKEEEFSIDQPVAVVYDRGQQIQIPIECIFVNGQEINYPMSGLKGCLRITPRVINQNNIDPLGFALYVSEKVRPTLFAQMFLFEKQWPGFEKVYDDSQNGYLLAHYDAYGRVIGPLKIWKINPPAHIKTDPYYLNTSATPRDMI